MRSLIAVILFATNLAHAQMMPCVPSLDAAALERMSVVNQRCGIHLQSHIYETGGEFRGDISIGLDANDAIRVMQNAYEPPYTLVQPDPVTHVGHDEPIYWGIWGASATTRSAMPYVAGVVSRSLPGGVARYSFVGSPFMISEENNAYSPHVNADNRGNPIDPGPISRADLTVDFGRGTATLNLRFVVRGVPGDAVIELKSRGFPSLEYEEADCEGALHCSTANLRFYGQGATHAGVLLKVHYERVMPEAGKVAAHLSNVTGQAAIGLERR